MKLKPTNQNIIYCGGNHIQLFKHGSNSPPMCYTMNSQSQARANKKLNMSSNQKSHKPQFDKKEQKLCQARRGSNMANYTAKVGK